MNKTLIAMAVAGVMAAPMAAQADATVYGKIHVSIDVGDTGGNDATTTIGSFGDKASGTFWQSNSSRIGFKGSEDLGGGLKAIWQFESNASFGSGNTSWGGRNSYVGLKGGWGEVRGGRHDTMFKTVGRKFDLFGDQVGDTRNLTRYWGGLIGQASGIYNGWDERPDNVVAYLSPTFGGGFSFQAAYVLDDATENANALTASAYWKSGNWLVGLGYEAQDIENRDAAGNAIPGTTDSTTGLRAGIQWKPGAWKLNAFYHNATDNGGISGDDSAVYGLGAAYKMGKNVLKAQYFVTSNKISAGTASALGITASDIDATLIAVGWDYNFSKRTTGYLAYSTTSNDQNIYYCTDGGGHGSEVCNQALSTNTDLGADPSVISLGMIHKF